MPTSNIQAFIFDLDNTLVNTNPLKRYRDTQNWKYVYRNIDLIKPFPFYPYPPHKIPDILHEMGIKIVIATSSPKRYAEKILNQFGIYYDLLIAREDYKSIKPDPELYLLSCEKLKISPSNTICVGDTRNDIQAGIRGGFKTFIAGWGVNNDDLKNFFSIAPDNLIFDPELLLDFPNTYKFTYLCERNPLSSFIHKGSILQFNDKDIKFFCLGRYYSTSDTRHENHRFSRKIIELKNHHSLDFFSNNLEIFINYWLPKYFPTIKNSHWSLVPVPPKPGCTCRFTPILKQIENKIEKNITLHPHGLQTSQRTDNYKNMDLRQRKKSRGNLFLTKTSWNENIILLDDVLSTGSTIQECAKVLRNSGAKNIISIVFGLTQFGNFLERKKCEICSADMVIRNKKSDMTPFWGCSDFPKCNYTESI